MTEQELLNKINNCKSEIENLNKRITDLQKQVENAKEEMKERELADILKDYEKALKKNSFWLEGRLSDAILGGENHNFHITDDNPYACYPSQEYAEKARKIKTLNDMILAFKWCYDRDYTPDWKYIVTRYFVVYDFIEGKYCVATTNKVDNNVIYFSGEKVAQKCCEWLNSMDLEDLK